VNLISTETNQGKVRFMVYKNKMNSNILIKFMGRLIKDSKKLPKRVMKYFKHPKIPYTAFIDYLFSGLI
jgi:hypothetical protein